MDLLRVVPSPNAIRFGLQAEKEFVMVCNIETGDDEDATQLDAK
jgi:hypothetical protein